MTLWTVRDVKGGLVVKQAEPQRLYHAPSNAFAKQPCTETGQWAVPYTVVSTEQAGLHDQGVET